MPLTDASNPTDEGKPGFFTPPLVFVWLIKDEIFLARPVFKTILYSITIYIFYIIYKIDLKIYSVFLNIKEYVKYICK